MKILYAYSTALLGPLAGLDDVLSHARYWQHVVDAIAHEYPHAELSVVYDDRAVKQGVHVTIGTRKNDDDDPINVAIRATIDRVRASSAWHVPSTLAPGDEGKTDAGRRALRLITPHAEHPHVRWHYTLFRDGSGLWWLTVRERGKQHDSVVRGINSSAPTRAAAWAEMTTQIGGSSQWPDDAQQQHSPTSFPIPTTHDDTTTQTLP